MNYEFSKEEIEMPKKGFPFMANLVNKQIDNLEEMWEQFSTEPLAALKLDLEEALTLHCETMHKTISARRDEFDSDDAAIDSLLNYVITIERRRVHYLNNFDVTETFYNDPGNVDMEDVRINLEDGQLTAVQLAFNVYVSHMGSDMNKLSEDALKDFVEEPPEVKREVWSKTVGKHALDVAKVGIGVMGGIVLAKKARLL